MKLVRSNLAFHNADVSPQIAVDGVLQPSGRKLALWKMHMRDLSLGMHARIRAPRPMHRHLTVDQHPDHTFEFALNGPVILLHLPPMKIGAVVLN